MLTLKKRRNVQSRLEKERAIRVIRVQAERIYPVLSNTNMMSHRLEMGQQSNIGRKMRSKIYRGY